jgi:exopolysaccharide production protein ExoZ
VKTIGNLQALRGIAAALVVVHHLRDILAQSWPAVKDVQLGAAGVDIFFVLSGVVIALSEARREPDLRGFAVRRIVRVVPNYWAILAVIGLMLLAGLSPVGIQATDGTFENLTKSAAFIPFERAHGAIMPLLGVGWTLNYEMFFYLVFAALIWLPAGMRTVVLLAVMLALVTLGRVIQPEGVLARFYTNPILLEFAAGVMLATWWMYHRKTRLDRWMGIGLCVVGCIGLLLAARPEGFEQLMPERALIFGIPAVLIVAGTMLAESGGARLTGRFWALMGAASYAVYLSHTLVLQIVEKVANALGLLSGSTVVVLAVAVAGFVASHVIGYMFYAKFEEPVKQFLSRRFVPTRRTTRSPNQPDLQK